jgi:hypothetical protein
MRYLTIYRAKESSTPPSPEHFAAMGQLIDEMTNAGTLLATEGCAPSSLGAKVRRTGDKITVTDGPFTEAKEVVAGFAIIKANSKEHAIELAKKFLQVAGDGESEIRLVHEPADFVDAIGAEQIELAERQKERMAANR